MRSVGSADVLWSYRPELDGMRTIAVYLVVLFHSDMAWAGGGFIGVDLFFVLSGFLVTNVIMHEVDTRGSFRLGDFYARRVRRLLPAAVLVIAVTCLLQLLVLSEASRIDLVADARAALLYFANWQFIIDANDYFGDGSAESPFLHFWSLSIEEQFYVVYPLLMFVLLRPAFRADGFGGEGGADARRAALDRERLALWVLAGLCAVSLAMQVWRATGDINYAYYATETRFYQLLAGTVLALVMRELGRRALAGGSRVARIGPAWQGGSAATVGLLALLVLGSGLLDMSQSLRGILATVASLAAIGGLYAVPQTPVARVLALPVPRYLGQISYGTYLWHWPVILVVQQVFDTRPLWTFVVAGTVATGLAALSFQVFETPVRRTAVLNPFRWPVVIGGVAVSVAAAFLVVPTVLNSQARPALAASDVGSGDVLSALGEEGLTGEVPRDIDFEALAEDVGDQGPECLDGDPESCLVVEGGDELTFMLIGDSHAAMLLPAFRDLAEARGYTMYSSVMNNCPWQDGLIVGRQSDDTNDMCAEKRDVLYDQVLPDLQPDVVLAVGKARSDGRWVNQMVADDAADFPDETFDQMLLRKAQETTDLITETGADLGLVHSLFGTGGYDIGGFDPLECLGSADSLGECVIVPPPSPPPVDSYYDAIAAETPGVDTVDLRPAYCPAEVVCAPIVGGEVTWKDPNHLSEGFVTSIEDELWTRVEVSGLLGEDVADEAQDRLDEAEGS